MIVFISDNGYCISIDIQVNKMRIIRTNLALEIKEEFQLSYKNSSFTTVYKMLYQTLDQIIDHQNPCSYGLIGISICVRGIVDLDGMIRFIPQLKWKNIDLISLLKERYHVPITINNDGNLSALSEYNSNPIYNNLAVINITDVLSTGLIINGNLVQIGRASCRERVLKLV